MNVGQMLVDLGFQAKPAESSFPCPAVITSREPLRVPGGYGAETKAEIEAEIDFRKSVGERATTKRSPGNWD